MASPERMRPTELSETRIMHDANEVVRHEAVVFLGVANKNKDGEFRKVIGSFLDNTIIDRKYDKKDHLIDPAQYKKYR